MDVIFEIVTQLVLMKKIQFGHEFFIFLGDSNFKVSRPRVLTKSTKSNKTTVRCCFYPVYISKSNASQIQILSLSFHGW